MPTIPTINITLTDANNNVVFSHAIMPVFAADDITGCELIAAYKEFLATSVGERILLGVECPL